MPRHVGLMAETKEGRARNGNRGEGWQLLAQRLATRARRPRSRRERMRPVRGMPMGVGG